MDRRSFVKATLVLAGRTAPAASEQNYRTTVYRRGEDGYFGYRIPALLRTPKGTLLAFAEARKDHLGDSGDIDVAVKRSIDGGKTWSAQKRIADMGPETIGNPCPVVDRKSGTILLPLTGNPGRSGKNDIIEGKGTRTVWISESKDDGITWTAPREITRQVKQPDWTWFATGPGVGIQLRGGRLLIPCNHRKAGSDLSFSHAMFSDDGGSTWSSGGAVGEKTNECQAVELANGSVLMNMRSFHGKNRRAVARSGSRGLTWSALRLHEELIEPACQASLIRCSSARGPVLLFSNPAAVKREKMTVKMSRDEGDSWPVARVIHAGPAAYSCLADLGGNNAGCLFECGEKSAYEEIAFMRFSLEWLGAG